MKLPINIAKIIILFSITCLTTLLSNTSYSKDKDKKLVTIYKNKKNSETIKQTDQFILPGQNYRPQAINAKNEYVESQFYEKFIETIYNDLTNNDRMVKNKDKSTTNNQIKFDNINKVFITNCIDTLFINKRTSRLKYTYKKGLALFNLNKLNNATSLLLLSYLASETNDANMTLYLKKLVNTKYKKEYKESKSLFLKFIVDATTAKLNPTNKKIQINAVNTFYKYADSKQPTLLNVRTMLQIIGKSSIGSANNEKWQYFNNRLTINSSHWLKYMIEGFYNLSRATLAEKGVKLGKTTKENSEAYYLALAGNNFKNAIEIYRTAPEAFTQMIYISSSGSMTHRNNPRLYFDQAIMASFDYQDAYKSMLIAALKSTNLMNVILFGDECLKTKRFDTIVPLFYPSSLTLSGYYMPAYNWRRPFYLESVKEKLFFIIAILKRDQNIYNYSNDEIATLELLFSYWCGNYKNASILLAKNPKIPEYNKKLKIPFVVGTKFYQLSRKQFLTNIYLYRSKWGRDLKIVDALVNHNKFVDAIKKLEDILTKLTNPEEQLIIIRRLIFTKANYSANRASLEKRDLLELTVDKGCLLELEFLLKILNSSQNDKNYKNIDISALQKMITNNKHDPIVAAIESNQDKSLQLLLKYYNPIKLIGYKNNALFYAIRNGNKNAIKILLNDKRIKTIINKPFYSNNLTPLIYATLCNNDNVTELLIDTPNIDLNKQSGIGKDTALHVVAVGGNLRIVMKLMSKQVKRNIKNSARLTALELAKNRKIYNFIRYYEYK